MILRYALALGVTCGASAWAQVSGVSYDVRIFHVAGPTFVDALDNGGEQPVLKELDLESLGASPETGLKLNDSNAALHWDGDLTRNPAQVTKFASESGIPDGWVVAIDAGDALQYIEIDEKKRFILKETEQPAGFTLSVVLKDPVTTMIGYSERFSAAREPLPGVQLDVGKPIKGARVNFAMMRNVPNKWHAWAVTGRRHIDSGRIFVFVRMHDRNQGVGGFNESRSQEGAYSCAFHVYAVRAGSEAFDVVSREIEALDKPLSDGLEDLTTSSVITPQARGPFVRDWSAVADWLRSLDDIELLGAPRITFSAVDSPAEKTESKGNAQELANGFRGDEWPWTSPIVSKLQSMGAGQFGVIADYTTELVSDASQPSGMRHEMLGLAIPVRVSSRDDKSVTVRFGLAHRFKLYDQPSGRFSAARRDGPNAERKEIMLASFHEEGFATSLAMPLDVWHGIGYVSAKTGDRILVFMTVSKLSANMEESY